MAILNWNLIVQKNKKQNNKIKIYKKIIGYRNHQIEVIVYKTENIEIE